MNCWEFEECDLQIGGVNALVQGAQPCIYCIYHASWINNGTHAGRSYWAIENTLCYNSIQPYISKKQKVCRKCTVYKQISSTGGVYFSDTSEIIEEASGYEQY